MFLNYSIVCFLHYNSKFYNLNKRQIFEMSSKNESAFSQNLYTHYRQYVQFLNDLIITKPYTSFLIFIPNLVMIMDLVAKFDNGLLSNLGNSDISPQGFFKKISYLGISQAIKQVIIMSQTIKYVILITMIILLFAPLLIGIQILIGTFFSGQKISPIGNYRKSYESSIIHKFIRIFIFLFQYISLPIWTSVGIKLFYLKNQGASNQIFFGVIILVLTPIVYLLGEYHLLQIIDQSSRTDKSPQMILTRKNFPNNIIDCILIYIFLIVINISSGNISFILAICFYLARLITAYYFVYYQASMLKQQYFTLISGLTVSSGLYIAFLCKQVYIVLLIIVLLLYLIANIKENVSLTQQYNNVIHQEKSVEQLKIDLWENGTFTYVFRQLIFQSKKNNSHRKQLLIEILKVKCFQLQAKSRGGAKIINSQDLIKFQKMFVNFIANLLVISDMSISILKLLQNKQPKRQIFGNQVKKLVNLINDNKIIMEQMREINDISHEGASMLKIMFTQFYNDIDFVKQMQHKSKIHITSLTQKQVKARLFNKKTAAIFINILDQVGKIAKVSKNIPAVLGYSPRDLLGLSINQIIPFSLKNHHDQILIKFIDKYNKKTMRSDPKIQFYSYNKDFHLQQVVVRYNFVMSYFSQFLLSGVFRKVEQDNKNVILTDKYGNIQGWTKQLGEIFNFDDFALNQCKFFNVLPLFPSLIKFSQQGNHHLKTVFFRSGKIKDQSLVLVDCTKPNINIKQVKEKQFKTFQKLLTNDEIIEAYLADIQYEQVSFCSGRVKMKKIIIRNFERIQNFTEIQDNIIKCLNGQRKTQAADDDLQQKSQTNKSPSISEYSMLGQQTGQNKVLDSNFTLDITAENAFKKDQLRLQSQVSKSQLSIDLTDANHNEDDILINDETNGGINQQNGDTLTENSFSPKLQTQTNFIPILIVFALAFIGIIIWDQVVFSQTQNLMNQQCTNVVNRNRALMIYAKSVFNTNQTYVREFDEAHLMQLAPYLSQESFNYKTYLEDYITQNKFYMFNIQIPSTLDRILQAPNDTQLALRRNQINYNFNPIMNAWILRFSQSQQYWRNQISQISKAFTIRLIVISIGSIAFSLFLIYIYLHYRKQKKMTQAFFKFQKSDLEDKMSDIRKIIKSLQLRVMQWHLQKQFYQVVKKKQITNLQFQLQGNQIQAKIKFDTSQETQEKYAKKNLYTVLFFIIIFLLTQLVFIILYSVLNYNQIALYTSIPEDLNKACKLIVLPNLMLANMFLKVPQPMLTEYTNIQTLVLEQPIAAVPNLFYLLEQAPCTNCTFMYPLLTTNFRSFYSTFSQIISSKTLNNDTNITDLFYAVDVVVEKISGALQIQSLSFLPATVILYLFSLSVFFISIYFGIRKMIEDNEKLQVFLKYFQEQILVKNKHMNGLFNKTN